MYCNSNSSYYQEKNSNSPYYLRGNEGGRNGPRFVDLGELEQEAGNVFNHQNTAVHLSTSSIYNQMKANNVSLVPDNLQFVGLNNSEMGSSVGSGIETGHFMLPKNTGIGGGTASRVLGNGHFDKWRDSSSLAVPDHSQTTTTDTSTFTDDKNQCTGAQNERLIDVDSSDRSRGKSGEHKALRRLAQNREAARKSRMKKKAYVNQLESSRLKLAQLEQELKMTRQQQSISVSSGFPRDQGRSMDGNGALAFDIAYGQWLDERQRHIRDLRIAVNSHVSDSELRLLVEGVMSHYDEIFRLKSIGAKSDVFHMLSGMWKTPVERCFMWLGGFRCSDVLKILGDEIVAGALTDQQVVGICSLQQSSQQAEEALSQGMEVLQQSLVDLLSSSSRNSDNVSGYMEQMVVAMGKLATLEKIVHQADLLRQQTLQQLQRILTTRQTARALLAIYDYKSRLRALSSLWVARPKE